MMRNAPMLLALVLFSPAIARGFASDSFVGVYGRISESAMIDDQYTVFAPLNQMRVQVSLANEEGRETFYLVDGLPKLLEIELLRDGQRVAGESLEALWADDVTRYSFNGEPVPETDQPELLEPGVGLRSEVTLARKDGRPFSSGAYELLLRVRPEGLRTKEDKAWWGRGGFGGRRFVIRRPESLTDRKIRHAILGQDHLLRGDHDHALAEFLAVVDLDPEDFSAYANVGLAYYSMKDHEAAILCFEKALPELSDEAGHSFMPLLLATSYVSVGERPKAVELLTALSSPTSAESQVVAIEQRLERDIRSEPRDP